MRPDRIVDLGLRTGPYRLTLDRLRRLPQGADLGVKGRPRHHLLMHPGDMAARELPGTSANAVTDPACLDQVSGTAVLNGVPVTVERRP
ncbi:hypothetical protein AB0K12_27830 [Nonomuraea sp. NPDC049419]|uniref:hypothetical protein n=1 Tax=Nonomuraea sp. NPDC049419 TaxID=3155772 RepID=UPI0034244CC2